MRVWQLFGSLCRQTHLLYAGDAINLFKIILIDTCNSLLFFPWKNKQMSGKILGYTANIQAKNSANSYEHPESSIMIKNLTKVCVNKNNKWIWKFGNSMIYFFRWFVVAVCANVYVSHDKRIYIKYRGQTTCSRGLKYSIRLTRVNWHFCNLD